MAKVILNDIQRVKKTKLILKAETASQEQKKSAHNLLDLSSLGENTVCYTKITHHNQENSSQKHSAEGLNDIVTKKTQEKFHYLHIQSIENPQISRYSEVMRMASVGLLILFGINVINIYNNGLNIKDALIASAASGYEDILQATHEASQLNFQQAENTFQNAKKNFDDASTSIGFLNGQNTVFTGENTVNSINNILAAGRSLSIAGNYFSKGIINLQQLPELFIQFNLQHLSAANSQALAPKVSLTEKLKNDLTYIDKAITELEKAKENLDQVNPNIFPKSLSPIFKDKLELAKKQIATLLELNKKTQSQMPAILKMLGDRYPHRYLVLLQNDAEARATGGFIGSFLIIDLNDGYITKTQFQDVYEFDGQLKEEITPPEEIAKITKSWHLRDSNYSPDFKISAEKAAWFLQKNGPSVDSVIAINQSLIGDLLKEVGPIKLPSLDAALDNNNYQLILSYLIESKLSGEKNPKKILTEFIPAFQKKLFENVNLGNFFGLILKAFNQKQVLLYSRDGQVEDLFKQLGATGEQKVIASGEDFLQIIAVSIGGNKSDAFISQNIINNTLIAVDGTVTNELTISRRHNWTERDLEDWYLELKKFGYKKISDTVIDILGRGMNKAIMKVYVPKGAVLKNVIGTDLKAVETHEDLLLGKTYFSFEMNVYPGNEQKVTLSYELPEKMKFFPADSYKFTIQKQPGLVLTHFIKKILPASSINILRNYPKDGQIENNKLFYEFDLDTDYAGSALLSN